MADLNFSLKADGEYLAYCAMKSALEDIVAMKDKHPWEADIDKAVDVAKAALECEERLGGA